MSIKYTDAQKEAINTLDQNLQIIACAGSGKTQVVSQRVVEIFNKGANPENIIAFTYTKKAAAELKTRILKLCKEQLGEVKGLADLYVGTIHGWCMEVLQDYVYEYQKFSVLDEIRLKLFVDRNYRKIGMTDLGMKIYQDTNLFINLMTIIRESSISPGKSVPDDIKQAKEKYEKCLADSSYFDFTMVMTKVVEHLESDQKFRKKFKDRLKYLIVDEYQDVNPIQEEIIQLLSNLGANLCVVGDDDQTLYQWRGSDVKLIQSFKDRYNNVKSVPLEDNFRSSEGIVDVALNCINNNENRMEKEMVANSHQKYQRGDVLYNQFSDEETEFEYIANTIDNLRGTKFVDDHNSKERGIDYSDIAILLRKWDKADRLIEKLEEANIPYIVSGVNNLFNTTEVEAAVGIFKYINGDISANDLEDFWIECSSNILTSELKKGIQYLDKQSLESYYSDFILQDIYWNFLEKANIQESKFVDEEIENSAGYRPEEIIFYNLGMFSQIIDDFEAINFSYDPKRKLDRFLKFLHYSASDYYPEGWLSNNFKTPNAVQIMTIFQSKGLEFPVVMLPGLNRNYLPIKGRGGKNVWHFMDESIIEDSERYKGSHEDERRLMYVAITRSKKFLIVSRGPQLDNRLYKKESKFGPEISQSDYIFESISRDYSDRNKTSPKPLDKIANISLNFSLLKAYFDCPYSFKFYSFYGFKQPLNARMGYGKSIHDALMEVHREVLEGNQVTKADIPKLVERHGYFPYATKTIEKDMKDRVAESLEVYMEKNQADFENIEFAEKTIQIELGDEILVDGRMDLIKKKKIGGETETIIVDFKSSNDVQKFKTSKEQLSLYALGYEKLTGEKADFLEIYDLDNNIPRQEELLIEDLDEIKDKVIKAADEIRENELEHTCNEKDCVCMFQ